MECLSVSEPVWFFRFHRFDFDSRWHKFLAFDIESAGVESFYFVGNLCSVVLITGEKLFYCGTVRITAAFVP